VGERTPKQAEFLGEGRKKKKSNTNRGVNRLSTPETTKRPVPCLENTVDNRATKRRKKKKKEVGQHGVQAESHRNSANRKNLNTEKTIRRRKTDGRSREQKNRGKKKCGALNSLQGMNMHLLKPSRSRLR